MPLPHNSTNRRKAGPYAYVLAVVILRRPAVTPPPLGPPASHAAEDGPRAQEARDLHGQWSLLGSCGERCPIRISEVYFVRSSLMP